MKACYNTADFRVTGADTARNGSSTGVVRELYGTNELQMFFFGWHGCTWYPTFIFKC